MKFSVFESTIYVVEATDGKSAIEARKKGEGEQGATVWSIGRPITSPIPDIPRDQWPSWAKVMAKRAMPEDKGIGDVVARTIGPETSGAFKAFYEMTFGKPCGCTGRQKLWNQKYPLNLKAT